MPKYYQDFTIPQGNSVTVTVDVLTSIPADSLEGSTVIWRAYPQDFGAPIPGDAPLISKSNVSGGAIVLSSPPMFFEIFFDPVDTEGLLGNYYHEATVVDPIGNVSTILQGILTVIEAANVP